MQHAVEANPAVGEDWAEFAVRHRQAVADHESFLAALRQVEAWHEAEVAKVSKRG